MATLQRPVELARYTSAAFRAALNTSSIRQSMSCKGSYYDAAVVESSLKTEEFKSADYQIRQQAETGIFSYLEGFYNTKRRHSSLGYLSPNDFEQDTLRKLLNYNPVEMGRYHILPDPK